MWLIHTTIKFGLIVNLTVDNDLMIVLIVFQLTQDDAYYNTDIDYNLNFI